MPANNQRPATQTPVSPRNTAKYTNKDGSKFITVPKGTPSESSLPPTPTSAKPNGPPLDVSNVDDGPAPAVNRKKQKRRQKAAAKAAAQQAVNGHNGHASGRGAAGSPMTGRGPADHEEVESDDENEYILASELTEPTTNGHPPSDSRSKKNRKKKKKGTNVDPTSPIPEPLEHEQQPNLSQGAGMSRDKIWSTSNQEERERIKAFWLGLGEDERKSLVKVEKDAVLKKMKEQQKHTCSCTVCGRKRTAIEEELEGLYDAYYLELEQFANQGEGPPMLPSARDFALRRAIPSSYTNRPPSRGRIVEQLGDEEDDEEEEDELEEVYSEDEVEDDDYSDDEPPEEFQTSHERDVADFLTFGNSLQVKGGILTVADDLLKNDGKRFIEMMEQLAERRMAREEDAREHFSRGYGHPNGSYSNPHNHPPPEEDEYDEEEDEEEDYDDSQDEEYEEEEDQMTEEQRMEEGRRMFQIFAARMFEQRVLSAYKEKVAKERQQRLLEEIEAEDRESELKKAKKAKDAQKKKDKAAQKKQALAEERARKEAEKAAADAARLEAERQRVAEQKARAEEKRKQKEAQKKAEEEARLRKEAERQRRLHEQREKQAEQERKARETKEKEKKLKEEQRQRDKEAREQKEREAQERKDKQERDKRDKEARAAKAQKDAQAAREAKEKLREEKAAAQKAASHPSQPIQIPKRASQHSASIPTALPQHASNPASYASPKIPVATPVLSKAPTPIRPRNTSQQQDVLLPSATVSSHSQDPSPHSMTPHMSPGPIGQRHGSASTQHSHSVSPTNGQSRMLGQSPFQIPPMGMQPPPGLVHHPPPPGFANRMPHEAIFSGFRHSPGAMMPPPGINGPPGRGFSVPLPPGFTQPIGDQFDMGGFPLPTDLPPPTHHRQSSLQFDTPPTPSQPIGRPAPIGRPGSLSQSRASDDQDDETAHLGSRALLEDDEPLAAEVNPSSLRNQPPGPRGDFTTSPFLPSAFPLAHNPWGPPAVGGHPLPPPGFNNPGWGAPSVPPGFGMTSPIAGMSSIRAPAQPRYVTVRAMLCQACKELASSGDSEGYIDIGTLKSRIDAMSGDHSISELDLLNLCETEGSPSNGGGTFDIRRDAAGPGKHTVRWEPDLNDGFGAPYRAVGAPGEIGSPLVGQATLRGGL
ncbi:Stress response protein nst1 [Fusarium venenatum]|nr:Stress response protein nst1 [Fusarium venenatum]